MIQRGDGTRLLTAEVDEDGSVARVKRG